MFNKLFGSFSKSQDFSDSLEKRQKESARRIVGMLSRGNISLQQGKYITKEQMDQRRKEVMNHDFLNPKFPKAK